MTLVEKSSISQAVLAARYSARKPFPPGTIKVNKCPICGHDERHEDFIGGNTNWARCEKCRSGYKMTWPEEDAITAFYESEYRDHATVGPEPYPNLSNKMTALARWGRQLPIIYNPIKAAARKGGRFLDIGTANAWPLHTMEYIGLDAYGVELNELDRRLAKEQWGMTLYPTLEELPVRDFDVVLLSHVLEHYLDPVGLIRKLKEEYMAPEAHLLVEVPSMLAASAWSSFHAVLFSMPGLISTLEQGGLEVVWAHEGQNYNGPAPATYPATLLWVVGFNKVDDGES